MNKDRVIWLDVVRIIACIMVCVVHAPIPSGKSSLFLSGFNYLGSPCNALFFMISGALLFPLKSDFHLKSYIYKKILTFLVPNTFFKT